MLLAIIYIFIEIGILDEATVPYHNLSLHHHYSETLFPPHHGTPIGHIHTWSSRVSPPLAQLAHGRELRCIPPAIPEAKHGHPRRRLWPWHRYRRPS